MVGGNRGDFPSKKGSTAPERGAVTLKSPRYGIPAATAIRTRRDTPFTMKDCMTNAIELPLAPIHCQAIACVKGKSW